MARLPLDSLQAGMILSADAIDPNGRVLLRAGVTLTESHLRVFRMWGLGAADIESDEPAADSGLQAALADPVAVGEARALIAARFHLNDPEDPVMVQLMQWCLDDALAGPRP